jgi:hypothetical protein
VAPEAAVVLVAAAIGELVSSDGSFVANHFGGPQGRKNVRQTSSTNLSLRTAVALVDWGWDQERRTTAR